MLYPLLLEVFGKSARQNEVWWKEDELPFISIVIAAHNEENVIQQKLTSTYSSILSEHNFEVLIGSDCSTDTTNQLIQDVAATHSNLRFYPFQERQGKAAIINRLVEEAKGEIIIFTDANVFFDEHTIYELVKHFKNSRIGQVGGNIVNTNLKETGISVPEKNYLEMEKRIKHHEGKLWGSMMGAFGGCYALRKSLYKPVPSRYLMDDFYISMGVFEQNQQAIFEPLAVSYEDVSDKLSEEFRRKMRISAGNFQNLFAYKHLLVQAKAGVIFSFMSHKILRWKTPFFLLMMMCISGYLGMNSELYTYLFLIQVAIFVFLPLDFLLKLLGINISFIRLITHFISMNIALFFGFFKFIFGVRTSAWKPTERNQ